MPSSIPQSLTIQYVAGDDASQVHDLLALWEAARARGDVLSADELCKDHPQLLEAVRQGITLLDQYHNTQDVPSSTLHPSEQSSSQPLLPDSLSEGRYQIRGMLGKGGMGVVYCAWDSKLQREVALKTLPSSESSSLLRFKQEFRALADLHHHNLVKLHELCHETTSQGSVWFFTMELVRGTSFLEYVRPSSLGKVLDETRLRSALLELATGLQFLHSAGRLHRDLKPTNVMVTTAGRVVLLDFGLAAELNPKGIHQSVTGQVFGTVGYMAPEQAAGTVVSPASDWYAVGAMIYEALAGRLPFGSNLSSLVSKQVSEPPSLLQFNPTAPQDLVDVCMSLLRRSPEERASGRELFSVLNTKPTVQGPSSQFVGRENLLAQLTSSCEKVRQGKAVGVLLSGISGVGKSTLLRQFFQQLPGDTVILQARCYEREAVPYKAIDGAIDSLCRHLQRLPGDMVLGLLPRKPAPLVHVFPVFGEIKAIDPRRYKDAEQADAPETRRRAFAGLREVFSRLSDRGLVILALDDVQWGDLDSAALLTELLHVPEPPAVLTLIVHRAELAEAAVTQAFRRALPVTGNEAELLELSVPPLSASEMESMTELLLGKSTGEVHAMITKEAAGLPLFVQMLARSAAEGTVLSLAEAFQQRIVKLPPAARKVLEAVAVAGVPVPAAACLRVAGLPGTDADTINSLLNEQLIRRSGNGSQIESYHDRIGETVVSLLSSAEVAALLEKMVMELANEQEVKEDTLAALYLATHKRADVLSATRVLQAAIAAAERASSTLAFDRAAAWYQAALALPNITELDFKQAMAKIEQEKVKKQELEARKRLGTESIQHRLSRVRTAPVYLDADATSNSGEPEIVPAPTKATPISEDLSLPISGTPDTSPLPKNSAPAWKAHSDREVVPTRSWGRENKHTRRSPWFARVMVSILVLAVLAGSFVMFNFITDAKPVKVIASETSMPPISTQPATVALNSNVPTRTIPDTFPSEPAKPVPTKHEVVINTNGAARGTPKWTAKGTPPEMVKPLVPGVELVKQLAQELNNLPAPPTRILPTEPPTRVIPTEATKSSSPIETKLALTSKTVDEAPPGRNATSESPWIFGLVLGIILAGVVISLVYSFLRGSKHSQLQQEEETSKTPEHPSPWRAGLEKALGDALVYAGRRDEAANAYQRAISNASGDEQEVIKRSMAERLGNS